VATRKLADTETWLMKVEVALCKLYGSTARALQNNIPCLVDYKASTLEVLNRQWIDGCGSLQALNIDCCMHMHTRNKGCGFLCTCSQQISLKKWAWLTKK